MKHWAETKLDFPFSSCPLKTCCVAPLHTNSGRLVKSEKLWMCGRTLSVTALGAWFMASPQGTNIKLYTTSCSWRSCQQMSQRPATIATFFRSDHQVCCSQLHMYLNLPWTQHPQFPRQMYGDGKGWWLKSKYSTCPCLSGYLQSLLHSIVL